MHSGGKKVVDPIRVNLGLTRHDACGRAGIVVAGPGTIPIVGALNALQIDVPGRPPDEWIRRLGTLPLASADSYGWPGIYGTGWYNDPAEDMTTILMI